MLMLVVQHTQKLLLDEICVVELSSKVDVEFIYMELTVESLTTSICV